MKNYIRVKNKGTWMNATRNGEKYVTEEVAKDMLQKLEEQGLEAIHFQTDDINKPVEVARTNINNGYEV